MEERRKLAEEIAEGVAKMLRGAFRKRDFKIELKEDASIVTEADLAAEKYIVDHIRRRFPDDGIVAEEGSESQSRSGLVWYIDPIDGSRNFALGIPLYAVSIGIAQREELVVGVTILPELKELYSAQDGQGALMNGVPISVSQVSDISRSSIVFSSGRLSEAQIFQGNRKFPFHEVLGRIATIRVLGSIVVGMCYVASGRLDGTVVYAQHPWDIAAGFVLIKEAGGKVSDLFGNPGGLAQSDLVFSNGKIHDELLEVLSTS